MKIVQRIDYDRHLASLKKSYPRNTGQNPGTAWAWADVCPKTADEAQRMWRELDQSSSYMQSGNNTRQL